MPIHQHHTPLFTITHLQTPCVVARTRILILRWRMWRAQTRNTIANCIAEALSATIDCDAFAGDELGTFGDEEADEFCDICG